MSFVIERAKGTPRTLLLRDLCGLCIKISRLGCTRKVSCEVNSHVWCGRRWHDKWDSVPQMLVSDNAWTFLWLSQEHKSWFLFHLLLINIWSLSSVSIFYSFLSFLSFRTRCALYIGSFYPSLQTLKESQKRWAIHGALEGTLWASTTFTIMHLTKCTIPDLESVFILFANLDLCFLEEPVFFLNFKALYFVCLVAAPLLLLNSSSVCFCFFLPFLVGYCHLNHLYICDHKNWICSPEACPNAHGTVTWSCLCCLWCHRGENSNWVRHPARIHTIQKMKEQSHLGGYCCIKITTFLTKTRFPHKTLEPVPKWMKNFPHIVLKLSPIITN